MGYQIMKRPDGQFAVYNTSTDKFIGDGVTKDEIINFFVERAILRTKTETEEVFDKIEQGKKPYYQFTLEYNELK